MFDDRKDAGEQLGRALERYRSGNPLVLAIPRGGVEVGFEAAKRLDAEFTILICRKLAYPDNPESGFGAVAEDGSVYLVPGAPLRLSRERIGRIMAEQQREIERRIAVLRHGSPLPDMAGRTVILVDDGIAVGSTLRAAVMLCRKQEAGAVVVAVPVTGQVQKEEFRAIADDVVVLETPPHFYAVAQAYCNWYDVSDNEVIGILEQAGSAGKGGQT